MLRPGTSRRQLTRRLNAAFADGSLSEETFVARVEELLGRRLIDPRKLTGDLSLRNRHGWRARVSELWSSLDAWRAARRGEREFLLALDWTGSEHELLIGRHYDCDVLLSDPTVSRLHARLVFRDGSWVVQDLGSTNGTTVNGAAVGRCVLRPGDHLVLDAERLRID